MRKAQFVIEYLSLIGMGIVIIGVVLVSGSSFLKDKQEEETYYLINDYGYSLQTEIMLALNSEPGYSRNITVPSTIGNRRKIQFTINNTDQFLIFNYSNDKFIQFLIPNMSGNKIKKGNNVIRNINGVLYIEN
ncbi:MAG: hypothetical protein QXG00_04335 [Candidatus Woesearchaeota archaeon]